MKSILVVGAGFSGATSARILADKGYKVTIIDKRSHLCGSAHDYVDELGILVHTHGVHAFHTNSKKVFEFLSRFTEWKFYEHRAKIVVDGKTYPMPVNRETINGLHGTNYDEEGTKALLERVKIKSTGVKNAEQHVLNEVGELICDKIYRPYSEKQWEVPLNELYSSVCARMKNRTNDDDRYFEDTYQFIPAISYEHLFTNMLDHKNITIKLNTDFFTIDKSEFDNIVYTGPVDQFFEYKYGKLPYKSIEYKIEQFPNHDWLYPATVVNYPSKDYEYTRITEFKHMTTHEAKGTTIMYEIPLPNGTGEPYYPILTKENDELHQKYKTLINETPNVTFVGRLAEYRYYNMDQAIASAMKAMENY